MPIARDKRPLYKTPRWFAVRARARTRARDRCQHCGRLNHSVHVVTAPVAGELQEGVRLLIIQCGAAHLNHRAGDDRLDNVAWLCRGDHNRYDKAHRRASLVFNRDERRPLRQLWEKT